MRERAVLERIKSGDRMIADMVKVIYASTDPRLHGAAAAFSPRASGRPGEKGRVVTNGPPSLAGVYETGLKQFQQSAQRFCIGCAKNKDRAVSRFEEKLNGSGAGDTQQLRVEPVEKILGDLFADAEVMRAVA